MNMFKLRNVKLHKILTVQIKVIGCIYWQKGPERTYQGARYWKVHPPLNKFSQWSMLHVPADILHFLWGSRPLNPACLLIENKYSVARIGCCKQFQTNAI